METRMRTALVQWWDHEQMHVLCPWCDEIHRHGFNGDYTQQWRAAHCGLFHLNQYRSMEYDIKFPLGSSSEAVCYEIDKQNLRFVAGEARLPDQGISKAVADRLRAAFREQISLKRIWTEEVDDVLSDMVLGLVPRVRRFLETSPHADLFLHGVQSTEVTLLGQSAEESDEENSEFDGLKTDGITALHLAVIDDFPDMVELLLSNGADPNAVDMDGRTPLMKAALWGRLGNVEVLLKYRAETSLQAIEGNNLRQAVDYARPLRENELRRDHRFYKEDGLARNRDRREIMFLLGEDTQEPAIPQLDGFTFHPNLDFNPSVSLTTHYSLPTRRKTITRLIRGGRLPEIAAMSGWSHGKDDTIHVAGVDWTQEVLDLCQNIGFGPEPHDLDRRMPGRFNACHAEKQLVAYFIYKHLILPTETQQPEDDPLDEISLSRLTLDDWPISHVRERRQREQARRDQLRERASKLQALQEVWPAAFLREAWILVSREACHDCQRFVERVNGELGLWIQVRHYMSLD